MIFIPSRKRRIALQRFFDTSLPIMTGKVLIDYDDESYEGMILPEGWSFVKRPRQATSARLNEAFEQLKTEAFYAVVCDDMVASPFGWDVELSKDAGSRNIAWGNDGRWGPNLCTSFFIGGDLARHLGWLAYPGLNHLYVDSVWWMIAKAAKLGRYRKDIRVTHINVKDQTYQERRVKGDHQTFQELRIETISQLIRKASEL